MNTTEAVKITDTDTDIVSIALATLIGGTILFFAGFAQADILHDSAHDMRHATGFACH